MGVHHECVVFFGTAFLRPVLKEGFTLQGRRLRGDAAARVRSRLAVERRSPRDGARRTRRRRHAHGWDRRARMWVGLV